MQIILIVQFFKSLFIARTVENNVSKSYFYLLILGNELIKLKILLKTLINVFIDFNFLNQ